MGTRVVSGSGQTAGNVLIADQAGNGDYQTIQAAIDAAAAQGPTATNQWLVLVAPGQYVESLALRDHVNVAGDSPDGGVLLVASGEAAIASAARCTLSGMRIAGNHSPLARTGSFAAGKTLRLVEVLMQESAADIDGLWVETGEVVLERCALQAGGIVAYLGAQGALQVFESRLTRYHSGAALSNPCLMNAGGGLRVVRSTVENLAAEGEAISFSAAPVAMSQVVHSVIKKSASAAYAIGATVAVSCLVSGCLLNADPQVANLSDALDYACSEQL